jgi:low affinity Fe/Cu permease
MEKRHSFSQFSNRVAHWVGHPAAFLLAFGLIFGWIASGPFFHFSDTWQLVINTGTTIVTFLMVFLIQNTQNRDAYALQLKLDELIRALKGAHNSLLDIEEMTEDELLSIRKQYQTLAHKARGEIRKGRNLRRKGSRILPNQSEGEARAA